jgi:hypothetical protein
MVYSSDEKIGACERLAIVSRSYLQLHSERCVRVSANPFSIALYPFVLEVIYSLEWGESNRAAPIVILDDSIEPHMSIIRISLDDHTCKRPEQAVIITSKWTQHGSIITAENSCNGETLQTDEFAIGEISQNSYFKAATMLKRLVRDSVTSVAAKKITKS